MLINLVHIVLKVKFKFCTYNFTIIRNKRILLAGKLNIIHGHELARGLTDPVNPARGFYNKAKNNVIGGHHHRTSEHPESDINGNLSRLHRTLHRSQR